MASPVQVKPEPIDGDVFAADTDSEADEIDIDKLQPLAPKLASLSKFPVGCHVWYHLRSAPGTGHLQAKSARVLEVSIHFENGRRVYKVKPEVCDGEDMSISDDEEDMSFYEDQLVYAINCPVSITKIEDTNEKLDGVVVYLEREMGLNGKRNVVYAVKYTVGDYITIEPRVAAGRIKYRADDCGVGVGGTKSKSSISTDAQKQTTCPHHEGDTDKEEKEADVSLHNSSAESIVHAEGNDNSKRTPSESLDTARWEPPKRSSGSEPKDHRPTKVAKREVRSEERDASKGRTENSASVRTLTIPSWWKNQWGPDNRCQLYARLVGKERMIKSSTNCSIRVDGSNPQARLR